MPFSDSRSSWLALCLSFSAFLAPLSPATLNVPLASAPQMPPVLTSQQQDQLHDLVARVLRHADKAGCKKNTCTILVANFTGSSGSTSILGMQLADELSQMLAAQQTAIHVNDRSRLRAFFEQQRIPSKDLQQEKALQWLGKHLGATAVLEGAIQEQGGSLRVRVNLRSCDKDRQGPFEEVRIPYPDIEAGLRPLEPFPANPPSLTSSSTPMITRAGAGGVDAPRCVSCPQPGYTDPARAAKFQGIILLEVVVSQEGQMKEARIVRGLPFGLNEAAMNVLQNWKFKPAMRAGEPIQAAVMIEVSFHLY
jgi:TonB family protein